MARPTCVVWTRQEPTRRRAALRRTVEHATAWFPWMVLADTVAAWAHSCGRRARPGGPGHRRRGNCAPGSGALPGGARPRRGPAEGLRAAADDRFGCAHPLRGVRELFRMVDPAAQHTNRFARIESFQIHLSPDRPQRFEHDEVVMPGDPPAEGCCLAPGWPGRARTAARSRTGPGLLRRPLRPDAAVRAAEPRGGRCEA
jgi:hypothetical protein